MRVVTVSRMPLPSSVAENCLKWGTGGLNIDGCRVEGKPRKTGTVNPHAKSGVNGVYGKDNRTSRQQEYDLKDIAGRWPTNVILSASDEVLAGFPESSITGERSSQSKAARVEGTLWGTDNHESTEYTDSGSSARFFKQIGGPGQQMNKELPQELITYLLTLIGSPDGEALFLGDLPHCNWGVIHEWEDNSQYGILAEGCPTEEQVAELQRVLRPGAHLLLVAPEEQPTGHTGTCRLEDGGFEIRDAILLIDEPGRFHYVPKTSRAEREAGCGLLPGKPRKETVCSQCDSKKEDPDTPVECPESDSGEHAWVEVELEAGVKNSHPCLHPRALIMTDWGYRPIEEVQAGDKVYSADGKFHAVECVSRHPYSSDALYGLFVKGTNYTVLASDNHPFLIWRPQRKGKAIIGGEVLWVSAENIIKGDYTMTPVLQEPSVESEFNEDFWFLFGLWLAEGVAQTAGHGVNVYPSYTLHEKETYFVEKIRQFFDPRGCSVSVYPKKEGKAIQVMAFDPVIGKEFVRLGGKGASTKRIHPEVFSLPFSCREAVVQGHMAGDGGKVRAYYQSKTVSPDLASQMHLLAESIGFRSNLFCFAAEPGCIRGRDFLHTYPVHQIQLYQNNMAHQKGSGRKPSHPTLITHEGVPYILNYVQAVVEVPYEGDVVNLTVEGSPTFQTAVGMSHNTVKPTKLMKRLLADVPLDGGPVLDPFMGSGTTLLACLDTGHDAIGIDQEADYVQIADARVRYHDRAVLRKHETTIESDCPAVEEPEEMSIEEMLGLVPMRKRG